MPPEAKTLRTDQIDSVSLLPDPLELDPLPLPLPLPDPLPDVVIVSLPSRIAPTVSLPGESATVRDSR